MTQPPHGAPHTCVAGPIAVIVAVIILFLAAWSFVDPRADVPFISPIVCSAKGLTWYPGGLLGAPGCYANS